jgi:signal transduction histidine kinase/ligand-binding sensor domain-containing protein
VKGICIAALLGLITANAQALDPSRAISQYAHRAWRNRDGDFASAPTAITQTSDGFIWVGTIAGLLRFDGVRFAHWTPPKEGPTLPTASIVSLLASRDGSLWIGTTLGLARWSNGTLTNYSDDRGHINSILEDQEGHVWIARTRVVDGKGPLCEVVGPRLRCYGKADGIEEAQGQTLALDSSGSLWLGSDGALTRWTPGLVRTYHPLHAQQMVSASADAVAADRDGALWVGFYGTGQGLGLERFERDVWRSVRIGAFHGASVGISTLLFDSSNSLWVGTNSEGLYRIYGKVVEHFGTSDGLSGDHVTSLAEDEERNVWVATSTGIDCFRDLPVVSYTKHEGLTADYAHSVQAAEDGTVWIGNVGGLDAVRENAVSSIRTHRGLPGSQVTAMLIDHAGRLWLGVDDDLYLYEQGHFRRILDTKGNPSDLVTQLAEDVDGSIWAVEQGPIHRLLHIRGNVIAEQFQESIRGIAADPHGGVWSNLTNVIAHGQNGVQQLLKMPPGIQIDYVSDIVSDHRGALWASIRQGVVRFDGGKTQLLGASNGLPCPSHGSLIFDSRGSLWLTQSCGIVRIDQSSLNNWIEHPEAKVSSLVLDAFDGVQIGYSDFHPSASLGRDGRLWFVNGPIVQMLDPEHLHINTFPPPIKIENLIADHTAVAITPEINLPPLTPDIEIDYTALSFVMPQRVRFRYKLEGHDNQWQDGGTRRSAFYTNLQPGKYKFLVTACNNSGVWNRQGAVISFTILPAWYQTIRFRLFALLAFVLLCYAFYRRRMRQYVAAMRARFNERLDERTQIARNLHDTLLQTIQGSKMVADQAKSDLSDPEKTEKYLNRLSEWLDRASLEGRAALESLRIENSGTVDLSESIQRGIDELQTKCEIAISFSVKGNPCKIHPVVRQEIFMIAYEAIGNACRHSGGQTLTVQLSYEGGVGLSVSDDGHGIDEQTLKSGKAGRFGLTGMRERAQRIHGTLNILSSPVKGTKVALIVPGKMVFEGSQHAGDSIFQKLKNLNRRSHPRPAGPIEGESEA